jgi:hypothetical protein
MDEEIAEVRANLTALVRQLAAATSSYRVAVESYRDFSERTSDSADYASQVDQTFTSSLPDIQAAINVLGASGGGDVCWSMEQIVTTRRPTRILVSRL